MSIDSQWFPLRSAAWHRFAKISICLIKLQSISIDFVGLSWLPYFSRNLHQFARMSIVVFRVPLIPVSSHWPPVHSADARRLPICLTYCLRFVWFPLFSRDFYSWIEFPVVSVDVCRRFLWPCTHLHRLSQISKHVLVFPLMIVDLHIILFIAFDFRWLMQISVISINTSRPQICNYAVVFHWSLRPWL